MNQFNLISYTLANLFPFKIFIYFNKLKCYFNITILYIVNKVNIENIENLENYQFKCRISWSTQMKKEESMIYLIWE
jgi:hypothetical protein